jgi:plasmid maintenance system killer protein
VPKAILYAFLAGRVYEGLRVCQVEHVAMDGRKHRQRMKDMQQKAGKHSPMFRAATQPKVLRAIETLRKEKKLSKLTRKMYSTVAEKLRVTLRTLYRYLKQDREKKK